MQENVDILTHKKDFFLPRFYFPIGKIIDVFPFGKSATFFYYTPYSYYMIQCFICIYHYIVTVKKKCIQFMRISSGVSIQFWKENTAVLN